MTTPRPRHIQGTSPRKRVRYNVSTGNVLYVDVAILPAKDKDFKILETVKGYQHRVLASRITGKVKRS